jgi:inorganic pyrophosphatase
MAGLMVAFAGVFFMCLTAVTEASPRVKREIPAYGSLYQKGLRGSEYTKDFRIFARDPNGQVVSYWHDIPLLNDKDNKIYNMILEIPKWTSAKMEASFTDPLSPVKQRITDGEVYFEPNLYPFHGIPRNYGSLPQTFNDPNFVFPMTQAGGDSESIDIFEIGDRIGEPGDVIPVKLLGLMAFVDEGKSDWKIIAVDTRDRKADQMNDIEDVEKVKPGLLKDLQKWVKNHKIPAGKPASQLALDGKFLGKSSAENIISETNRLWKELVESENNPQPNYNRQAVLYEGAKEKLSNAEAEAIVKMAPEPAPPAKLDNIKLGRSYYFPE